MMSLEFLLGVWFFLWALLWAVYFMLDGFDLGAATLMPFIAKMMMKNAPCTIHQVLLGRQ